MIMRSLLKKRLIYIFAILIGICCVALSLMLSFNSNAVKAESLIDGTIASEYFIGENFKVPSGNIIVDGTAHQANATVLKPDGTAISANEELILDVTGKYEIKYQVKVDGKSYYDIKSFNVYKPLYEVLGNGTALYCEESKLDGARGVKLALTENSVFRLNKKINLYDIGKDSPFIKLNFLPEVEGYAELNKLFIKVIDANDASTFFALQLRHFSSSLTATENVHVFGHINNLSTNYAGAVICDPQQAAWNGTILKASFEGLTSKNGPLKEQALSFYFNEITQDVGGLDCTETHRTVLSLGSFPNVWGGFTTGDVYIELYGLDFLATEANIFISDIAGVDLSAGMDVDDEAPVINIDYAEAEGVIPNGYVGCSYPIFDATAYDYVDGTKVVVKSVYYNYYSDDRAVVPVVNGGFTPQRTGTYTIVYTAVDKYSNIGTECIDVEIRASIDAPAFTCSVQPGYIDETIAAERLSLAEVSFIGGVLSTEVSVEITKDGHSYEFDVEGNTFTPMETGTFNVKYIATDFLNRKCEFSYDIIVSASDVPVFTVNPDYVFGERFIAGYRNVLPKLEAVFITSNNEKKDIVPTISVNNGTIENGYYMPATAGDIKFTCTATYQGVTTEISVERKAYSIKNEKGIDLKSLFIATSGNVEATYSSDNYAEYKITGTGKIEYLNYLLAENASLVLNTDAENKEIAELVIRYYNPMDRSRYIQAIIKNFDGAVYASIDDMEFKAVSRGDFSGSNPIDISYIDYKKEIVINGISYNTSDDYNGIGSDYVIAEIEVKATEADATYGLIVQKVGNQMLISDTTSDRLAPMIACVGDYGGSYEIGETYVLPKVLAADMISPSIASFKMTVIDPFDNYVIVDGMMLNGVTPYQAEILLSSYGQYYCEFEVEDQAGRTDSFGFSINVIDNIAPKVWSTGTYATSGTVGKAITIATCMAQDNLDAEDQLNMKILVLDTNHNFVLVKNQIFTPNKVGTYEVYCYVTDSFGNVGLFNYKIEVK